MKTSLLERLVTLNIFALKWSFQGAHDSARSANDKNFPSRKFPLWSEKFPGGLESFQVAWKVSKVAWKSFKGCLESFHGGLASFQEAWKVSRLT